MSICSILYGIVLETFAINLSKFQLDKYPF